MKINIKTEVKIDKKAKRVTYSNRVGQCKTQSFILFYISSKYTTLSRNGFLKHFMVCEKLKYMSLLVQSIGRGEAEECCAQVITQHIFHYTPVL